MFTKRTPFAIRFSRFVKQSSNDSCWLWVGAPNSSGYGTIRTPGRLGKTVLAHRAAYTLFVGPIPDGLCVLHKCDNPVCVNPNHLFLGTNKDNVDDRQAKGRCRSRGLPGEHCGHAKLSNKQALAILTDTRTQQVIADCYGVSRTAISNIKRGATFKFLRTLNLWKD